MAFFGKIKSFFNERIKNNDISKIVGATTFAIGAINPLAGWASVLGVHFSLTALNTLCDPHEQTEYTRVTDLLRDPHLNIVGAGAAGIFLGLAPFFMEASLSLTPISLALSTYLGATACSQLLKRGFFNSLYPNVMHQAEKMRKKLLMAEARDFILQQDPNDLSQSFSRFFNKYQDYILRKAISRYDVAYVKQLLLLGADIHIIDIDPLSAIEFAIMEYIEDEHTGLLVDDEYQDAKRRIEKIIKLLIKHGADINKDFTFGQGDYNHTLLHYAVSVNAPLTAKFLLSLGTDVTKLNNNAKIPDYLLSDPNWRKIFVENDAHIKSNDELNTPKEIDLNQKMPEIVTNYNRTISDTQQRPNQNTYQYNENNLKLTEEEQKSLYGNRAV